MSLPNFEYVEPKSLKQAARLLRERDGQAQVIAGGTDLMQSLKNRLKTPQVLVDLKGIPSLGTIRYSNKRGLAVGAFVTLRRLANAPIVKRHYPLLVQALLAVGTPQLQAMGTVGGNLCQDNLCLYYNRSPMMRLPLESCLKLGGDVCNAVANSKECWAVYSGDLAPVLLVLNARITIAGYIGNCADGSGKQDMHLSDFYTGDGEQPNRLSPGEILTRVLVPPPAPNSGGAYLKMRLRKVIDYPLLGVACYVRLEDGVCAEMRLALTGIDRAPLLIQEARNLEGKPVDDAGIEVLQEIAFKQARPLSNVSEVSPRYRREMVRVYVRDAIKSAVRQASRGEL